MNSLYVLLQINIFSLQNRICYTYILILYVYLLSILRISILTFITMCFCYLVFLTVLNSFFKCTLRTLISYSFVLCQYVILQAGPYLTVILTHITFIPYPFMFLSFYTVLTKLSKTYFVYFILKLLS